MMNKAPTIYTLRELMKVVNENDQTCIGGHWLPARPMGFFSIGNRLHAAWLAFTGRADVVRWLGQ